MSSMLNKVGSCAVVLSSVRFTNPDTVFGSIFSVEKLAGFPTLQSAEAISLRAEGGLQVYVDVDGVKHCAEVDPAAKVRDVRAQLKGFVGYRELYYDGKPLAEDAILAEVGLSAEALLTVSRDSNPDTVADVLLEEMGAGVRAVPDSKLARIPQSSHPRQNYMFPTPRILSEVLEDHVDKTTFIPDGLAQSSNRFGWRRTKGEAKLRRLDDPKVVRMDIPRGSRIHLTNLVLIVPISTVYFWFREEGVLRLCKYNSHFGWVNEEKIEPQEYSVDENFVGSDVARQCRLQYSVWKRRS